MPQVGIPALARFLLTIILVVTTPQALHAASPNSDAIASSVRSGTDALLGARDAWQRAATQTGRSAAEQQMLRVAAVRMQALQHLVESSPDDGMAMALAPAARATFPASVQPYLESMRGGAGGSGGSGGSRGGSPVTASLGNASASNVTSVSITA